MKIEDLLICAVMGIIMFVLFLPDARGLKFVLKAIINLFE